MNRVHAFSLPLLVLCAAAAAQNPAPAAGTDNAVDNEAVQWLRKEGLEPEDCAAFHLVAHGPIYPEVEPAPGLDRAALMAKHLPLRDLVGAMEKALAEELKQAGYRVLNTVKWKHPHDPALWETVRAAFSAHFPKLAGAYALGDLDKPQVAK